MYEETYKSILWLRVHFIMSPVFPILRFLALNMSKRLDDNSRHPFAYTFVKWPNGYKFYHKGDVSSSDDIDARS